MTRPEAVGVAVGFLAIGLAGVWLIVSQIWGRRRIPERPTVCSVCGDIDCTDMACMAIAQNQINRTNEKARRIREEVLEPSKRQFVQMRPAPGTPIRARRRD